MELMLPVFSVMHATLLNGCECTTDECRQAWGTVYCQYIVAFLLVECWKVIIKVILVLYHILWWNVFVYLFILVFGWSTIFYGFLCHLFCLFVCTNECTLSGCSPGSSTRAAALGLSLRSDSHSGPGSHSGPDSYCTVLTLIHALTLAALFWWWMVKVLVDLVLTVISARIEYNDRHVCLQF